MKYRLPFILMAVGSLFFAGCASPYAKYSDAASHFPPIQPGNGRLVVYSVDPQISRAMFTLKIDDNTVGKITYPYALFFDRPAGDCTLGIKAGALVKVSTVLNLVAGQTQYVQLKEKDGILLAHYFLIPTDSDQAAVELGQCSYFVKHYLDPPKQ